MYIALTAGKKSFSLLIHVQSFLWRPRVSSTRIKPLLILESALICLHIADMRHHNITEQKNPIFRVRIRTSKNSIV